MQCISVDFPTPLGPRIEMNFGPSNVTVTSFKTGVLEYPNSIPFMLIISGSPSGD